MKRKILAITISLALLSSLLIFTIPAAAGEQGAESPFTIDFDMSPRTGYDADAYRSATDGPPVTLTLPLLEEGGPLETRTFDFTYRWLKPWVSYHEVEGDFGPLGYRTGTMISTLYCLYDYSTGKVTGHRTVEIDLGGDDRAVFKATGVADFVYWNYDVGPEHSRYPNRATRMDYCFFDLVSGTGEFKKLEISGNITRDVDRVMHWIGEGSYLKDYGYVN